MLHEKKLLQTLGLDFDEMCLLEGREFSSHDVLAVEPWHALGL